jgi:DNA-directed RNA polymerase subunit beta
MVIAQSDAKYDETTGKFIEQKVKARYEGDFPMVDPEKLEFMDIAPNQIVSIAAIYDSFLGT